MTDAEALDRIFEGMPPTPDGTEVGLAHIEAGGVYMRRSAVLAGSGVRMHTHGYDHISILAAGRGRLLTDDGSREMVAGDCIEVKAGKRHAFMAREDCIWLCAHNIELAEAAALYKEPKHG